MESLADLAAALSQVANSDQVDLQVYVTDIYDVVCGRSAHPLFSLCLPLRITAVNNLFKTISNASLSVTVTEARPSSASALLTGSSEINRFVLDINYHGKLRHRITGGLLATNNQLHGQYRIDSATEANRYDLIMYFNNGQAYGNSLVHEQDGLQQISYGGLSEVETIMTYHIDSDQTINIFSLTFDLQNITSQTLSWELATVLAPVSIELFSNSSLISPVSRRAVLTSPTDELLKTTFYDYELNNSLTLTTVDAYQRLLNITEINSCGKTVSVRRFNPNQEASSGSDDDHSLSTETINKILQQLSQAEAFQNVLAAIYYMLMARQASLVSYTLIFDHTTLIVDYHNAITISLYSLRYYDRFSFDQEGYKL